MPTSGVEVTASARGRAGQVAGSAKRERYRANSRGPTHAVPTDETRPPADEDGPRCSQEARRLTCPYTRLIPPSPPRARWGLALSLTLAVLATLALLPAIANAYVYWANYGTGTIARADLDGSHVDKRVISGVQPWAVAVDADHLYWANVDTNKIGRADLDGSHVDKRLITGVNRPRGVAVDALNP